MYEQILFRYIRATSFAEMTIEPALRKFLTECGFRLPGEGQKVSRFVECFEKVYWADNSGTAQCPFTESSTVFLVGYAIIMLNSDHHRANVGKRSKAKMSKDAFIRNLSGTCSVILLFFLLFLFVMSLSVSLVSIYYSLSIFCIL
jgi:Sec7-like guanine-nucleotide exchange factor